MYDGPLQSSQQPPHTPSHSGFYSVIPLCNLRTIFHLKSLKHFEAELAVILLLRQADISDKDHELRLLSLSAGPTGCPQVPLGTLLCCPKSPCCF